MAIGLVEDNVFNSVVPGLTKAPKRTCDIPMVPENGARIVERDRLVLAVTNAARADSTCACEEATFDTALS
ncbi:hypothetical protein D3C73_863440 [compost metagenome]